MSEDNGLPGPAIMIALALGCLVCLVAIIVGANALVAVAAP